MASEKIIPRSGPSIGAREALAGKLKGVSLNELPIGEKTTWKEWRAKHPKTKVLSVNSRQDGRNPYQQYFRDKNGFRGIQAKDRRLNTKSPIFAFHFGDISFAIPYSEFESGGVFALPDDSQVFLYHDRNDKIFQSTAVFISKAGFGKKETSGLRIRLVKHSTKKRDISMLTYRG